MEEISYDDVVQQYRGTVVMVKGKPHKVVKVYDCETVRTKNLITQRQSDKKFSVKEFCPITTQLGFVNVDNIAIYVSRQPHRQYRTGVAAENCELSTPAGADVGGLREAVACVKDMGSPEFADMILGHYPSIEEAFNIAFAKGGCVAFDRHFAVDAQTKIYYKTDRIGLYTDNNIELFPKYKYLTVCLKGKYAVAPSTFR